MHGGKVPSPIATVRRNRRRLPSRLPSRVRVRVWACAFPVKGRRIYRLWKMARKTAAAMSFVAFGDQGKQVANEVDPAALVPHSLEHP
jgi:hypothetical protein